MSRLRIELLGPIRVTCDGEPLRFAYDKQAALLAYLCLAQGRPVTREKLGLLFWPDKPPAAVQTNVRQALARLRQFLETAGQGAGALLAGPDFVQLALPAGTAVDVVEFEALAAAAAGHRHRHAHSCSVCHQTCCQACTLYRGDFLEGLSLADSDTFESWAAYWREHIRVQALAVHQAVAEYSLHWQDATTALAAARRLVALDPLHEEGNQLLMAALARQGQSGQALAHYAHFRQALERELGVEPAARTEQISQAIRSGRWPAGERAPADVPVPATPLVGRQVEAGELNAWLNDPDRRLITITGLGGTGKTHLAATVARQQATVFGDGAVFLPLAEVRTPETLLPALAEALGCPLQPQQPVLPQLAALLRDRDLLLVLDHFEHLLAARRELAQLLERCPNLVILVTSRQRLRLVGEWVFPLGGLDAPPPGQETALASYSAASLFVQAATQVQPDFVLDAAASAAVAEICRLVEGLPLALVLLGAWVRVLPCPALAAELRRSMELIRSTGAAPEESTVSLEAVLAQSWQGLEAGDRQALAALSIFHGGFDQQAAQAIAGAGLDTLGRLLDHSLVQASPQGRYSCHELVRLFAATQLGAAGQAEQTAARHFAYFAGQAENNWARLQEKDELAAFLWFGREHANLEQALLWAQAQPALDARRLAQIMALTGHGHGVHRE